MFVVMKARRIEKKTLTKFLKERVGGERKIKRMFVHIQKNDMVKRRNTTTIKTKNGVKPTKKKEMSITKNGTKTIEVNTCPGKSGIGKNTKGKYLFSKRNTE